MSAVRPDAARPVEIGRLLDDGAWTAMQKGVVVIAALAVLLDGFDSQLISFAIPVLIKEWGVSRAAFAPVVAAGLVGMSLGSACAGYVGDRFGRRSAILGSVLLFGVATCLIGLAPDLPTIGVLRFFAGLGIGGALPTSTTMTAEFTPARRRTMMVTATIVCVPLGGMLAGLYAGPVLPSFGWRALFLIGGALPILLSAVLFALLPESPRYLARRPARWPDLVRLLGRMGRPLPATSAFTDSADLSAARKPGIGELFAAGRARDTVALWGAFFLCLLAVYSAFGWLPTMLSAQGLNVAMAGAGLTAYNLGGALGALVCAGAITRLGSLRPLVVCAVLASVSAFALDFVDIGDTLVLIVGLGVHGFFVNAVQSTLYAVAAYVYPTAIRATGTAFALSFGRLGAVLSAVVGAAFISAAGPGSYLDVLAFAMLGAALFLLLLRHHIPPAGVAREASDGAGAPRRPA